MRSIKEIYITGHGPSSSHTMGPAFACDYILKKYNDIKKIEVTLYGSLALTGKGHLTDYIIHQKFNDIPHKVIFDKKTHTKHPNTIVFVVTNKSGEVNKETVLSIGGGTIVTKDNFDLTKKDIYPHNTLCEILKYCEQNSLSLKDYVMKFEDEDIFEYVLQVYDTMMECRERGIEATGELPGSLHVKRKAREMFLNMREAEDGKVNSHMNVAITAFAVAEENASGGIVVTAPTCGSAGVVPGCIAHLKMKNYSRKQIAEGLLVGGLIGMIAKTNATVSGAQGGCQAEIGVACAMAAAMVGTVYGLDNDDVAQSAEIAMEHSLGLTCDPVKGYVQIPCIERCAVFALKALGAVTLAKIIPAGAAKVTFDQSVKTMYQTGLDIKKEYRETSMSGLAKIVNAQKKY